MKHERDSWTAAGEMVAVAFYNGDEVSRSRLAVLPANFSDSEYRQMLLEIGLAAVSSSSWVHAHVGAHGVSPRLTGNAVGLATVSGHSSLATLAACVDEIDEAMPTILRRPLVDLKRASTIVPADRVMRTPRGVLALVKRPGRRAVTLDMPSESLDCTENQYLRWVVERVLVPLARLERIRGVENYAGPNEELEQMFFRAADRNERLRELEERVRRAAPGNPDQADRLRLIDGIEAKLKAWRGTAPLQAAAPISSRPYPTERLLGTPGYRSVLVAMQRIDVQLGRTALRGIAIADAVLRREVGATWRCYETWCVVQIVRAFAVTGGFRTPSGEKTLGELLEIAGQEVRIPRGIPLVLERKGVRVDIEYEPRLPSSRDGKGRPLDNSVGELTPDILVSIQRGEEPPKHFILDAKYRDYAAQGLQAKAEDVCVTALLKYRDGCTNAKSPTRKEIAGSYILHSDPADRHVGNDYWGGMPAEEWLPEGAADALPDGWTEARGHAAGLIRLRPDEDRDFQLGRLLDMWLQYHVPPNQFECSRCGSSLKVGTDVRMERAGNTNDVVHEGRYIRKAWKERWQTSVICVCPNCSNYWFQNHCQKAGHPLFKLGRRSYHEPSRKQWPTPGMYICPTCGDDPSPEAFHLRNARPEQDEGLQPFADDTDDEFPF